MELKLDGYITEGQFALARKLGQQKIKPETAGNLKFYIEAWMLFLFVGVVFAAFAIGLLINLNIFIGFFIALLAIVMIVIGFKARKALKEQWKTIDGIHFTGHVTEEEVELSIPTAQSRFGWDAFSGYGEEGDIVLLLLKNSFQSQIITRQFFKDENDWQVFREIVARNLPETHSLHQSKMEKKEKLRLWLVGALLIVILFMALLSHYR